MRTTLLAAALAAAFAAPALAGPPGTGVSTALTGDLVVGGAGTATGDDAAGSCSYSGTTVNATGWTKSLTNKSLFIDVQCQVLIAGVWYGAWAQDSASATTQVYESNTNVGGVPSGAQATRICLTLTAMWDGFVFQNHRCVTPGAYGWYDHHEVRVPFDPQR